MRKAVMIAIAGIAFGMGLPYALNGQWWAAITCLLAGGLWAYPSHFRVSQRATVSFAILATLGSVGIFWDHAQLWSLTNVVLLLMVWDLDHYTRVFQVFEKDQASEKMASRLFFIHLKRLGILAGLGWCAGFVALNVRIQISFAVALFLIGTVIFGLRQVARYLVRIPK